jgi:hypothetical protein
MSSVEINLNVLAGIFIMSIPQTIVLLLKLVTKAFKWRYNCSRSRAGQIGWCARKFQRKEGQTQTLSWLDLPNQTDRILNKSDFDRLGQTCPPLKAFRGILSN